MRRLRPLFWVESALAVASGLLAVVTVFWHDWIEITGWDPDDRNGAMEWLVVVALGAIAVVMTLVARVEWRRPLQAT